MPNFMEHVGNIAKNTKLSSIAETMASKFADFILSGTDDELITLDVCVKLAKQEREKILQLKIFCLR